MRRRSAARPVCVFDTVVLSNYALAGALDWLAGRFRGLGCIPQEVLDELAAGAAEGYGSLAGAEAVLGRAGFRFQIMTASERRLFRRWRTTLGAGEAACIAIAAPHRWTVASDDRAARNACSEIGLPMTGTIGILKAAVGDGALALDAADDLLARMKDAGYYSPIQRLREIL
jgi:predicted nucleic acid-binding protein